MTITPPASGNVYADAWTLSALSTVAADEGTWTITLQVTLQDYTGVAAVTQTISNAVVKNPCAGTSINAQTMTSPLDYQLVFA